MNFRKKSIVGLSSLYEKNINICGLNSFISYQLPNVIQFYYDDHKLGFETRFRFWSIRIIFIKYSIHLKMYIKLIK